MSRGLLGVSGAEVPLELSPRLNFSLGWCSPLCVSLLTAAINRLRKMGRKQPRLPLGQGFCFVPWADADSRVKKAPALAARDGSPPLQAPLCVLGALNPLIEGVLFVCFQGKNRTLIIICRGLDSHYRTAQLKLNHTVVTLLKILSTVCCRCPADRYF